MQSKVIFRTKNLIALSVILFIAGCAGIAREYPNQPAVAIGSQLQLNLTAVVPGDQNQIYIQNRRVVSRAQIDKEQVYCSVVMQGYQQVGAQELKVEPGEFIVWRVRLYNDFIYEPTIYANTDDQFYSPSYGVDFRTEIHLKSSTQSDVRALSCTEHKLKYEHQNSYPDRAQFEAVLGELVTLP